MPCRLSGEKGAIASRRPRTMASEFAFLASFEVEQGVGGALLVPFRGDSLPPTFDFGAQRFDLFVQFIHRIHVQVLARQSD